MPVIVCSKAQSAGHMSNRSTGCNAAADPRKTIWQAQPDKGLIPFIEWDGARFAQGVVAPPLCTLSTPRSLRLALNETGRRRECVGVNQRILKDRAIRAEASALRRVPPLELANDFLKR